MTIRALILTLPLWLAASPAASELVDPTIDGDEFSARIELGGVSADLTVRFENIVGLSVENLGISVHLVDPLDLDLLSRLPSTLTGSIDVASGFPVLIRIDPPEDSSLAFEGVVEIELYTQNLQYTIGSPFRMFTAPTGSGTFHDITEHVSGGSYRTRSGGTHFSDFMILVDTRSTDEVVEEKFGRLEDALDASQSEISSTLHANLSGIADQAFAAYSGGDPAAAIQLIDDFRDAARSAANAGQVPNVWRATRDATNIDGALRATARTLRFSLTRAANLL